MAEYSEIYSRAFYYDIVFRRDVSSEVDFLCDIHAKVTGRPLRSMIDIACGPGYHAQDFARRGIKAYALDLRPEMIAFARDLAVQAGGPTPEYMTGDMRDFSLPAPVDLALTSFDSLDCLATQDEIIDHFRAVARNLVAGGLYVFEMTHPRDCSMWNYGDFRYSGARNGISVDIEWAVNRPSADPLTQVVEPEVVMTVNDNGQQRVFRDKARERFATAQEYVALARLSGVVDVVGIYGDYRLDQPLDNTPKSRRMIVVLRKAA